MHTPGIRSTTPGHCAPNRVTNDTGTNVRPTAQSRAGVIACR